MDNIGIVVKIEGNKSIIISEYGTFETIKRRDGMFTGQKVLYEYEDIMTSENIFKKYVYPLSAGVAALFVIGFLYLKFFYMDFVYAYVNIDINPSIELAIDNKGLVKDVLPINKDGEVVLDGLEYEDRAINEVVLEIIQRSKAFGFIDKDYDKSFILISTAINGKDSEGAINSKEIVAQLEEEIDNMNLNLELKYLNLNKNIRGKAQENKMSMGKYYIYQQANKLGKDLSIDYVKTCDIESLIKENSEDILYMADNTVFQTSLPSDTHTPYDETPEATIVTPEPTVNTGFQTSSIDETPLKASSNKATPNKTPANGNSGGVKNTPITNITVPNTKVPQNTPDGKTPGTKTSGKTPETDTPKATNKSSDGQSIKVKFYNDNSTPVTNTTYLRINLFNTGKENIDLSDVKLRYYYTIDGEKDQVFNCDWSPIGPSNVTGRFVKMEKSVEGADTYLEIGFESDTGNLKPGKSVIVNIRYTKKDWSDYKQYDDYSYNPNSRKYIDWEKVTGYISGELKWGIEP